MATTDPGKPVNKYNEAKPVKTTETGKFRIEVYPTEIVTYDKATGREIGRKPTNNQYGASGIQEVLNIMGDKARYTHQDFGTFNTQHRAAPEKGTYRSGSHEFDWEDLRARHGDWIDSEYAGKFDSFVKDLQDPTKSVSATKWFQSQVNSKIQREHGSDKTYFTSDPKMTTPYALDGKFGQVTFSVPRMWGLPEEPKPAAEKPAPVMGQAGPDPDFVGEQHKNNDGWWLQDIANFATSMTDSPNKYDPMLQQVDLTTPDVTFLDPSRQVAAIKEQTTSFADMAQNTSEGQVARANMLASSGQAAGQVADVLSQYENANVGIANDASRMDAQIQNQEAQLNAGMRDQYVGRMATVNQQYDNAKRENKYRQLNAFVQGVTNNHQKKMMEQVLYQQVHIDPITGDVRFSGKGKDVFSDPGGSPIADPMAVLDQMADIQAKASEIAAAKGLSPEATKQFLQQAQSAYTPKNSGRNDPQLLQRALMNAGYPGMPRMGTDQD